VFNLRNVSFHFIPFSFYSFLTFSDQKAKERLPQICSVKPPDRITRILDLPILLQKERAKAVMDTFKMKVQTELIAVKATSLPQPWLMMPGVGDFQPDRSWGPQTGRDLKYTLKQPPRVYTCYVIFDQQGADMAKDYATCITKDMDAKSSPMKVEIAPVQMAQNQDPIAALTAKVPQPKMPCMLLVFLGDAKHKLHYAMVKEFTNKQGIISQCLNVGKQRGKAEQKATICGNIMVFIFSSYSFSIFLCEMITNNLETNSQQIWILMLES
jgi:hypothetical protein